MPTPPDADLEELLAEALQRFEAGGEPALQAFVAEHPRQASALERGIRRCREMGLLMAAGATAAPPAHPERLGDYRLVRRIGGGGMGVVYEAVHEPLGRSVALKVVRPELLFFDGARERFRREIDAIAKLVHPGIVTVLAAGEHEGVPFFAMERIDGLTLDQLATQLQDRDPAKLRGTDVAALLGTPAADATDELFAGPYWEVVVRITMRLAQALRHAHLRGIVHRDVKPSNGIVTAHGRVVVLDFGVAQVRAARELTRTGDAPGSPAFMSPEQWDGQATDERTDVFSLAATAWNLLTLQRPFKDATQARAADRLPPLRGRCRAAPPELDLVLRTAMDPERDRRHRDMARFAADLQAVLERRPIAARPLGRGLRLLRWSQRHRAATAALAVTALAGAVSLSVLVIVQRNNSAALTAEQERTRASLDTTIAALQSILVRVGNTRLLAVPQAEPVAHEVLNDAANLFRTLCERHPDDHRVRTNTCQALNALALSCGRRGDLDRAIATVQEGLALLDGEHALPASTHDVRAHAWASLAGFHLDRHERDASIAANARAVADYAAASRAPQLVAESLRARAELHTQRSLLHDEQKEPDAVEHELRSAVDLQRECIAYGDPDPKDPALLVQHLTNLGKFLQRRDRGKEARDVLEQAMPLARALPTEGTWPPPAVYVAEVQDTLGSVLLREGDPGAEALLRDSIGVREQAVADYPSNIDFRIRLGGALHNLARIVQMAPERTEEALALLERAREVQQAVLQGAPRHRMALDFLGKHLDQIAACNARLGRVEPLVAAAQALAELPSRDAYRAARCADLLLHAWRLDEAHEPTLLDRAMALLLVAERRGLKATQLPAKVFAPLQDRADYQELRQRLTAAANPAPAEPAPADPATGDRAR